MKKILDFNEKQTAFIIEYAKTDDLLCACAKAGISKAVGVNYLADDTVSLTISECRANLEQNPATYDGEGKPGPSSGQEHDFYSAYARTNSVPIACEYAGITTEDSYSIDLNVPYIAQLRALYREDAGSILKNGLYCASEFLVRTIVSSEYSAEMRTKAVELALAVHQLLQEADEDNKSDA